MADNLKIARSFSIPAETKERLVKKAETEKRTLSNTVLKLIIDFLEEENGSK